MRIAIAGSTGFIGKQLSAYLLQSGNELIVISRDDFACGSNQLAKVINSAEVIINLAGAPVLQRWSKKNKELILTSRIDTTRLLVSAVRQNLAAHCPQIFINGSAIGIYEDFENHDETSSKLGSGFLAKVCKAWESQTLTLKDVGIRLCTIRIGIVLGTTGGSFRKMLPVFKMGFGGKIGSGTQPFSFIHISDFCRAIDHLINNQDSRGVYNFCSPEPTTNQEFTNTLSGRLQRPAYFTVPEFALRLIYGEAAEMLTRGARVKPARLLSEGFQFHFPDISTTIADLVHSD